MRMNFRLWLEEFDFIKAPEEEDDDAHYLTIDGKRAGSFNAGGNEFRVARMMFPDAVKEGDKVKRIFGIGIDDDQHKGLGFGKYMYLKRFASESDPLRTWFYNSQTEPGATNAYNSLERDGYIEIHWKGRKPNYDQQGDVHLVRITPKGLDVVTNRPQSLIKSKKEEISQFTVVGYTSVGSITEWFMKAKNIDDIIKQSVTKGNYPAAVYRDGYEPKIITAEDYQRLGIKLMGGLVHKFE